MADGLAQRGIHLSERTCGSYRDGSTEPSWSMGRSILWCIDMDLQDRIRAGRARSNRIRELLG